MRLPFFYGWIIVGVTFVTMAIGVNARTSFSLLFPPIIGEFGWERGVTAGAFSFGFLVSEALRPLIRRMMDRHGDRSKRPHLVFAAVSADYRRVRLGAKTRCGRLLR